MAFRNATHLGILGIWATFGVLYSLGALMHADFTPLAFWVWFGCFAALMTGVISKFKTAIAALLAHAGAIVFMSVIPAVFPFSLLRLGLDLLSRR
ncbi:MAG: hypothetical protein QM723_20280 [Myxococcaceae bacterium]